MIITNGQFPSIEQAASQYLDNKKNNQRIAQGTSENRSFADILINKQSISSLEKTKFSDIKFSDIKFSKHAANRLSERNIELTDNIKARLNAGMQAAEEKGINESLVMVDQLAFIVNIKNQTVITALDQSSSEQNVFTNIDGAVIA